MKTREPAQPARLNLSRLSGLTGKARFFKKSLDKPGHSVLYYNQKEQERKEKK